MHRIVQLVAIGVLLLLPSRAWPSSFAVVDVVAAMISVQNPGEHTRGFGFRASQDVLVESLGVWNHDALGLHDPHRVGIWDEDGNLLVWTTVQRASAAMGPLIQGGVFRYEAIAPFLLTAGTSYVIGAEWFGGGGSDLLLDLGGTTTTDPLITITSFGRAAFTAFDFPSHAFGGTSGYFGPNFIFSVVPEPTTASLFAFGLAGLAARKRINKVG